MKLTNIKLKYGDKIIYDNFNIEIPENKITCILGPSGCGKTSLLNIIAGIVKYEGNVDKKSDEISFVFQNPLLIDHLTVYKNVEFVLKQAVKNKKERAVIIENILNKTELLTEKDSYPSSLSGGMAQRLSLARAFAYKSDILLMDEPFKGLDISLKKRIITVFSDLYSTDPKTTVFVTHDIDEAILLADKIIVLGNNSIVYEKNLHSESTRNLIDYSDLKEEIYAIL